MTEIEKNLLVDYTNGRITLNKFYQKFPFDIRSDLGYARTEVLSSISTQNLDLMDISITLIWLSGKPSEFVDILNKLLINPNHTRHQEIAKALQEIKDESTIHFVKKVLNTNFDYLQYTCSDDEAIAKWFSWILYSIGTHDAIELIKEFSLSSNEGIKKEMIYRLSKISKG